MPVLGVTSSSNITRVRGGRCRTRGTKHSEYCGHCEEFQAQIVLTIRNSKLTQLNIASFFVVGKKHAFSKDCEYSLS
jgi:hypothetical protein